MGYTWREGGVFLHRKGDSISTSLLAELQRRIKDATDNLAIAERELEHAIRNLDVVDRADKTMISHVIQIAFEKVVAAKRTLEAILAEP